MAEAALMAIASSKRGLRREQKGIANIRNGRLRVMIKEEG